MIIFFLNNGLNLCWPKLINVKNLKEKCCFMLPHESKWNHSRVKCFTKPSPNLISADVLNNTQEAHNFLLFFFFFFLVRILYCCILYDIRSSANFNNLRAELWWIYWCDDHWKGQKLCHFSRTTCSQERVDNFGYLLWNSSGHKKVKLGRNTYPLG